MAKEYVTIKVSKDDYYAICEALENAWQDYQEHAECTPDEDEAEELEEYADEIKAVYKRVYELGHAKEADTTLHNYRRR